MDWHTTAEIAVMVIEEYKYNIQEGHRNAEDPVQARTEN